jgi:hypothetical protein
MSDFSWGVVRNLFQKFEGGACVTGHVDLIMKDCNGMSSHFFIVMDL